MYLLAVCVSFVEPVLKFFVHSFRKKKQKQTWGDRPTSKGLPWDVAGPRQGHGPDSGEWRGRADRLRRRRGCRDTEQDPRRPQERDASPVSTGPRAWAAEAFPARRGAVQRVGPAGCRGSDWGQHFQHQLLPSSAPRSQPGTRAIVTTPSSTAHGRQGRAPRAALHQAQACSTCVSFLWDQWPTRLSPGRWQHGGQAPPRAPSSSLSRAC